MTRKFTQFAVFALAILTAQLLETFVHHYFKGYLKNSSPYEIVVLNMVFTVIIFYPAFHFIEKFVRSASEKYVEKSKGITRNRLVGLMLGFAVALLLLFAGFAQVMYHKNPFIDFKLWLKGLL